MAYNTEPTWQAILNAAKEIDRKEFSVRDIVKKIRDKGNVITEISIQAHMIGMAPNHPSSIHKPVLREKYPVFEYLGNGLYKVVDDYDFEDILKVTDESSIDLIEDIRIIDSSPMITDPDELGDFYILISNFEKELREVIKLLLGSGIYKRLSKDLPNIIEEWNDRKKTDESWGIQGETELINYALITDYMIILRKYKNIFTIGGDDELNTVLSQLRQFASYGRNPIMHCRTLSHQKYYTTISSVNYLKIWINRIRKK